MIGKAPAQIDPFVQQQLERVDREFQRIAHKAFTVAPLAAEIPDGGMVLARIGGTSYIYIKIGTQVSRVALTDV